MFTNRITTWGVNNKVTNNTFLYKHCSNGPFFYIISINLIRNGSSNTFIIAGNGIPSLSGNTIIVPPFAYSFIDNRSDNFLLY